MLENYLRRKSAKISMEIHRNMKIIYLVTCGTEIKCTAKI
jgi:hypothetical protein